MRSIYSTNPNIWRSADGRETPISEMEDTHLMNTIGMLHRKAKKITYDTAWNEFNNKTIDFNEFTRRIADENFDWTSTQVCIPNLLEEAYRRELDWKSYTGRTSSSTTPPGVNERMYRTFIEWVEGTNQRIPPAPEAYIPAGVENFQLAINGSGAHWTPMDNNNNEDRLRRAGSGGGGSGSLEVRITGNMRINTYNEIGSSVRIPITAELLQNNQGE